MRKKSLKERLQIYLAKDANLQKIFVYVKNDFDASGLTAHNWEHIYRDTLNAIVVGEAEKANMNIVLPAIVMHDIGFLYGASGDTHGAVGAAKLPEYLKKIGVSYPNEVVQEIAKCIKTHKGSVHNEKPESLEAKVVSDADNLEKFGPFGVYQYIRTFTEFNKNLEAILRRKTNINKRTLETKTGRKLAYKGRKFVRDFFTALDKANQKYM